MRLLGYPDPRGCSRCEEKDHAVPLPSAPAAALSTALLGGEGAERWRRRLEEENRDRVIVFLGAVYGIFPLAEIAVLTGLRLKTLPPEVGTRPAILACYGLGP